MKAVMRSEEKKQRHPRVLLQIQVYRQRRKRARFRTFETGSAIVKQRRRMKGKEA
jgi:hypothetical protein